MNVTTQAQISEETCPALPQDLPDLAVCRANAITDNVGECLVDRPWRCPLSVAFGYSYLCVHPCLKEIVARTRN
jgi:hypothetical protein